MQVNGPDWPSTASLREALKDIKTDKVVNWGTGAKNGLDQLKLFRDAGLPTPEFTSDLAEAKRWIRAGIKTFGRRLHHTQGSDIIGAGYQPPREGTPSYYAEVERWITTRKGNRVKRLRTIRVRGRHSRPERFNRQWEQRDFWVKVLPSVAEYRQHVWNERCIRLGKKSEGGEHWRAQPVRSRANGWHIDYSFQFDPESPSKVAIRDLAKHAVGALGYVGGAVDILEVQPGQFAVLEVNSAPSLRDEQTLIAYVEAIKKWVAPPKKKRKGSPQDGIQA